MVDKRLERTFYKTIISRRTIRCFKSRTISWPELKRLINAGRLAPSGANLQPLEFVVVNEKNICARIFPHLRWAAYIHPSGIPPIGRRPVAYIIVLVNLKQAVEQIYAYDVGAAVENIILTARVKGIGACWIGSIDRQALGKILNVPTYFRVDSVISLGYPDESPKIEKFKDSIKYWKDKKGTLHVPKRELNTILHHNIYQRKCKKIK